MESARRSRLWAWWTYHRDIRYRPRLLRLGRLPCRRLQTTTGTDNVSVLCGRIIDMSTNEDDLGFTALCDRFRAPTNIRRTMTREGLQQATGLDAEVPDEGDGVVLGTVWRVKCRRRQDGAT